MRRVLLWPEPGSSRQEARQPCQERVEEGGGVWGNHGFPHRISVWHDTHLARACGLPHRHPGGKRIYVDPFLTGNPKCPENELEPERVDAIFLTHGHDDHVGDTVALAQKFECPVVAQVELRVWLAGQGVELNMAHAPNKGGTVDVDGIKVTLTTGNHSSSRQNDGTTSASRAGSSSSSRTASSSTSPATRTSSATWR